MAAATLLIEQFDGLVLDLDGTVYVGDQAIPHAAEVINDCQSNYGRKICYATNNASRTPEQVAANLREFGLEVQANDVVTSAQVACALLAQRLPAGAKVLVVGGDALAEALAAEGLSAVWSSEDDPVAVVQGFNPDIGWQNLAFGAAAVERGLPWMATNRDLSIPTKWGIAPGNGTLVNAISAATGKQPDVAGKPEAAIMLQAARLMGSTTPLAVGDRLDTDFAAAHAAGMESLMVLTGVSGAKDLCSAPVNQRPHYFGGDMRALLAEPSAAVVDGNSVSCNGWSVEVDRNGTAIDSRGARGIDGVTAVANGAWLSLGMNARVDQAALTELSLLIDAVKSEN